MVSSPSQKDVRQMKSKAKTICCFDISGIVYSRLVPTYHLSFHQYFLKWNSKNKGLVQSF